VEKRLLMFACSLPAAVNLCMTYKELHRHSKKSPIDFLVDLGRTLFGIRPSVYFAKATWMQKAWRTLGFTCQLAKMTHLFAKGKRKVNKAISPEL
jgi:hypothetical protein